MRRAAWVAYFIAVLNVLAGYFLADEASSVGAALVPAAAGLALAACGYVLATWHSRAAGVGLLVATVAILVARSLSMGRPGPLVPGLLALYVFWQGIEAAAEWKRLRDHVLPVEDAPRRAV